MSLGYLSMITLASERLRFLAPAGQMALTNYLAQSIIWTWLIYGHGLGLWGELPRWSQIPLSLGFFSACRSCSAAGGWPRFRFGPVRMAVAQSDLLASSAHAVTPPARPEDIKAESGGSSGSVSSSSPLGIGVTHHPGDVPEGRAAASDWCAHGSPARPVPTHRLRFRSLRLHQSRLADRRRLVHRIHVPLAVGASGPGLCWRTARSARLDRSTVTVG